MKSLSFIYKPITIYGILFLILVYRLSLDLSYLFYVHPYHFYNGFSLELSPLKTVASYFLLIVFSSILPKGKNIGDYGLQFFFLFVYVPLSSYFNLSETDWLWFGLFQLFWAFLLLTIKLPIYIEQRQSSSPLAFRWIFWSLLIFVIGIVCLVLSKVGVQINFDLYAVYEIRAEKPQEKIPFGAYTVNWIAKVILPFFLLWFLSRKGIFQNSLFLFPAIAIVLLFFVTGHKAFLFNIPFLILCWILIHSKHFFQNLLLSLIGVAFSCLFLLMFLDHELAMSLFVRRTLFIPAQLSFFYHDFFEGNPILLSNSIFQPIFSYPHPMSPPYLIADYYLDKPEMSANNGIIADGFMHFGIIGIILWAITFGLLLKLFSDVGRNKNGLIFGPLLLMGLKTWVDGALLTGILTHGIGITILLLLLYPSNDKINRTKNLFSVFKISFRKQA
jgi:oligosaccharide repeat unit polymerase